MIDKTPAAGTYHTSGTLVPGRTTSVVLTVLAIAATLLAIALVAATWLVPQSRDRAARAALRDYAEYFGATVVGNVQWDLQRALHDRLFVPSRQKLFARADGPPSLGAWEAASRIADSCRCVPPTNEVADFVYDDSSTVLETSVAMPHSLASWLTDTLRALPRQFTVPIFLAGTPLTVAIAYPGSRGPGLAVAARIVNGVHGRRRIYGYIADVRPLIRIALPGMMGVAPLFPGAMAGHTPNDSLVALVVRSGRTDTLVTSTGDPGHFPERLGPFYYRDLFGGVTVSFIARSDVMHLLQPGTEGAMIIPSLGAALVVVLLLTVMFAWLMRRDAALTLARSNFLASVSHELRTPVAQLVLYGDMLRLGQADTHEERRNALDMVVQEAERLANLVENVLHMAHGDDERIVLRTIPCELAALIEETVDRFLPLAAETDMSIELDLDSDVIALIDRDAMTQVILNLLDNAAKYGSAVQTIHVSLRAVGTDARIAVDDDGPGVDVRERERIWKPFVRLPGASERGIPGSGIGLSVVRDLVTAHGGHVSVERSPAGGARFIVSLPLSPARIHDTSIVGSP